MLVAFGNASGKAAPVDPFELSKRGSLFMTRPSLSDYTHTRAELAASAQAVFDLVQRGVLSVLISERVPLLEAMAAHQLLESRDSVGAIVLKP
jgi:NADPH2:quinone reductase